VIENTAPAFVRAIEADYGIECDLQPAANGFPVVFHDDDLDRLIDGEGPVSMVDRRRLAKLTYRDAPGERILSFADFLDLVAGRVPLLVEIKSDWGALNGEFLGAIAERAERYRGPIALMSFDPAAMVAIRGYAPKVPRGIVSGIYRAQGWWCDVLDAERRAALSHLLESRPAFPDFYAYHVADLPTPVMRFVREVLGLPLFAWTVRTAEHWRTVRRWADAAIFEGKAPK
jgi:glycerophosphoryl diester phosphodiesterase